MGNTCPVSFWDLIIEKVFKQLDGWKRTKFSLGRHVYRDEKVPLVCKWG